MPISFCKHSDTEHSLDVVDANGVKKTFQSLNSSGTKFNLLDILSAYEVRPGIQMYTTAWRVVVTAVLMELGFPPIYAITQRKSPDGNTHVYYEFEGTRGFELYYIESDMKWIHARCNNSNLTLLFALPLQRSGVLDAKRQREIKTRAFMYEGEIFGLREKKRYVFDHRDSLGNKDWLIGRASDGSEAATRMRLLEQPKVGDDISWSSPDSAHLFRITLIE